MRVIDVIIFLSCHVIYKRKAKYEYDGKIINLTYDMTAVSAADQGSLTSLFSLIVLRGYNIMVL